MRVAVDLPQVFGAGAVDAALVRDCAVLADELGLAGAWVSEDMLTETGSLDALTTLAYAAAVTERVDLGVAVLLGPLYNPVQLAKATATLDQLSAGRLILGLGLGGDRSIYPAFGVSTAGRAQRFDAVVQTLAALWRGEQPEPAPGVFDLQGRRMRPRPHQAPQPRLWFGGHTAEALHRAVRYGTGFVGGGAFTSAAFASAVTTLRPMLAEAGRGDDFAIAKRVYVGCDDHVAGAGDRLRTWMAARYRGRVGPDVAITGDRRACLAGLGELVEAGADYLILSFAGDYRRAYEGAARDFLPALAAADR